MKGFYNVMISTSIIRNIYPVLLLAVCLNPVMGQQGQAEQLSLQQAIHYALEQSTAIKDAKIAIADAEQRIIENRAWGLPQLTGDLNFQRYLQVPKVPLPVALIGENPPPGTPTEVSFFLKNNFTASVMLDAVIFDGSYFVGLQAARTFRSYTQQELISKQREVKKGVIHAYLPVLLMQKTIELLDRDISILNVALFETVELYKAGFAEQLDVDRQELSLSNLHVERENLLRQKEIAINNLKFSMGYPLDKALLVTDDLEEMAEKASDVDLTAEVSFPGRPEYALAGMGIRLNELNVKLNKIQYLPTLKGFGVYSQNYQSNTSADGFWAPTTYVGLNLNVPVFDGLEKKAKTERARLDLELAKNQKNDLQRSINLEVANARTAYRNARKRLESQKANLELAERIFNTTQIKYREGIGSSFERTQAEQSLYATQLNYMQALYDLLVAKLDLDMALGK